MSDQSYIINCCQVSGSKKLLKILDLGYLPPVNISRSLFCKKKQEFYFPTELMYSKVSKLFQLSCIVDKKILFPKSYPYTSSTTKILRDNFADLYEECKKKKILTKSELLVDIGSNDGNLLTNFKEHCKILGVTPENIGKLAIKKGIPTLIEYFDDKVVKKILNKFHKAKVITATNVFAHIDKPNELLKNISKCLLSKGIFIIEVHYFCSLIKNVQYDTIYHEHMRYYSLQSLNYLLNKNNFKIFDAKLIPTHGGSIRIYASKFKGYQCTSRFKKILKRERFILSQKNIKNFKIKVSKSKIELLKILINLKNKNKKIYAVGSPSRAVTLVNYVGLDENIIDCILEVKKSKKINTYMPGTNIPILDEKIIFSSNPPDYLLLLSWHISKELINSFRLKGFKGDFIIPLPNPKILRNV